MKRAFVVGACLLALVALVPSYPAADKDKQPLTIAYSDWTGWLVWEIAPEKKYFDDAGVKVEMKYANYDRTLEDFRGGKADGLCVVCGESLTFGDRAPSTAIVLTDYSNGSDKIIAREG